MPASPYPTALLAELQAALSADAVLHGAEDLRPYECDGLAAVRELPLCVALPTDREGVQAVLQICQRHGVAVVPRGAGTGL
ncbi:glycolate oxidase, subunit GlcD, partial [Acidithiobacillus sp. GGI-221]